MNRGLIEKELRQHGLALVFVLLLVVAGVGVILKNGFMSRAFGTPFASVRFLLLTFLPLAGLVLAQVLIVTEYRHKTQLFLEGLPLPRWRMIAIKYALGLVLMAGSALAVLGVAWQRSSSADVVTPLFLVLLTLRSLCYVWFLWSLCFAHGFMGRYRFLFGVLAFVVIKSDWIAFDIDPAVYGPFELTGDRFAYERFVVPWTQLAVTSAYALFWMGAGFMLGLARDANIAAALAQRMSSREKVALTFGIFAVLLVAIMRDEGAKNAEPIHLPGSVDVTRGPVQVSASAAVDYPTSKENAALEHMAVRVADELAAVADYLHCKTMPPFFIVHRRYLKPNVVEDAGIKKQQGVMLRMNLTAENFDERKLLYEAVFHSLLTKSLGRLNHERAYWVLEGFDVWWPSRNDPPGKNEEELRAARKAMPRDFSARDVDRWLTLLKRAGDDTHALAAMGMRVLHAKHGEEASRRFLNSVLAVEVEKKDSRAWLRDVLNPVPRRFRKATGVSLDTFVAEWREAVQAASPAAPPEAKP